MEIIVQSPHFTITDKLKKFAEAKADKFSEYDGRILKCEILLKLDKSDTDTNKECEIIINLRHAQLFASRNCLTFEEAISESVRAMEQQLKKKIGKRRNNADQYSGLNIDEE